jgi:electron transfer flavoprotein alpha subunit
MPVLVVAEHDNKILRSATLHAVTAARAVGQEIEILVAGSACRPVAEAAARIAGIARVRLVEAAHYAEGLAEPLAPLIAREAKNCSHVFAAATTFGKNVMPRVAALLDVGQISEIVAVEAPDCFVRPIYAGNALATVRSSDPIKVATVRTASFEAAKADGGTAQIGEAAPEADPGLSAFRKRELTKTERPELAGARIVISGGRGMQSGENFKLLEAIADKLGAAIGASRAAVDAGFVPNDYQVGQTGKVIAPDLYIAVGISGAIQHLAGMKDSKVIVAINKDEDAPIFQIADYGLVADLFQVLPELATELAKLGK